MATRKKAGGVRGRRPCRMAPPMALGLRLRIALSSTAARIPYPMPVSFAQSSSSPCWRPQCDKSRGRGGRAPAITPAGAAVIACLLTQNVKRSGPQPFQVEPRGESPPAGCAKPTRRNAGVATGPPNKMQGQLRWRLSGGIFGGMDSSVRWGIALIRYCLAW